MWMEHVDGEANAAEEGTGTGADDPVARGRGAGLPTVDIPLGIQCVCPDTAEKCLAWSRQPRRTPWLREEGVLSARAAACRRRPLRRVSMRASEED